LGGCLHSSAVELYMCKIRARILKLLRAPGIKAIDSLYPVASLCGHGASNAPAVSYTVRKMGLILRSIERMLKIQFSIACKFTLQPLRRYDVKPPEKQNDIYI
jgi:hypothetical protein